MNWWDSTEPPVRDLAQRLARKAGLDPEQKCLPYEPQVHKLGLVTVATLIHERDLAPVWSQLVGIAREALATRDEQVVDAVVPPAETVLFTDDPDAEWRNETGLSYGEDREE